MQWHVHFAFVLIFMDCALSQVLSKVPLTLTSCHGTLELYYDKVIKDTFRKDNDQYASKSFKLEDCTGVQFAKVSEGTCCWKICEARKCQDMTPGQDQDTKYSRITRLKALNCDTLNDASKTTAGPVTTVTCTARPVTTSSTTTTTIPDPPETTQTIVSPSSSTSKGFRCNQDILTVILILLVNFN